MDSKLKRYYQLKQKHKAIEQELTELRSEIIDHCEEQDISELEAGSYKAKIVLQERKEYDDNKLYEALPDPEVWRMLSKSDPSKIASLITLNVISREKIKDTFSIKSVSMLHVDKK
ncbi:hypothetical protein SAMN05661091_4880 [Paenibacillus uliginis N3/975]|uniref:Uncharacterized protein n=1 Tax=Paenibacillus uliginis N3/975 TaxID=1313296 RepID=A0A1X7HQR4_9BACL|nr:hypothetical protein [Paenibacillus uliginis]SMF90069.1 hypothetical protein SAMN05661091_4880 [Paenibacillus uliginis N3/975]